MVSKRMSGRIARCITASLMRLRTGRKLNLNKRSFREEGASLVETAIALALYLSLFFGFIEVSLALYTFNFVSDAAREATRWASVRGHNSCTVSSTFPSCNLLPTSVTSTTNSANNPVLAYIDSLKYPALTASNVSADVTWWSASQDANGHTSWTTQCTGATDGSGNPCNQAGNAVKVVVTYSFPLSIPFWKKASLSLSSISQMMINE